MAVWGLILNPSCRDEQYTVDLKFYDSVLQYFCKNDVNDNMKTLLLNSIFLATSLTSRESQYTMYNTMQHPTVLVRLYFVHMWMLKNCKQVKTGEVCY